MMGQVLQVVAHNTTGNARRLVVVLGMHRSGTSAITRSLALLGVGLGRDLHPAGFDNPTGFWEDRECIAINEQLLERLGSSYDRLGRAWDEMPTGFGIEKLKARAIRSVARKLAENGGVWGFKDPRTCRLSGFWNAVFAALQCKVDFVIAVRNPASVAASLLTRNNIPAEKSYYLWLQHVLPSLRFAMGARHVVVDYDELLENPYAQLSRVASRLELPLPPRDDAALQAYENAFLQRDLRHARYTEAELASDARASVAVVKSYRLLLRLARDQASLESAAVNDMLDELGNDLELASPAFGYINALEDQRTGLWQTLKERDYLIAGLHQAAVERSGQLAALNDALAARAAEVANCNALVTERDGQIAALSQAVTERNAQLTSLNETVAERDGQIAALNQAVTELNVQLTGLNETVAERDTHIAGLVAERAHILSSTSWTITKPLRFIRRNVVDKPARLMRKTLADGARHAWSKLPVPSRHKQLLKHHLFSNLPALFGRSRAYRSWAAMHATGSAIPERAADDWMPQAAGGKSDVYMPLLQVLPPKEVPVRLIAFYLPQFHAIAENNAWWGEGFTEWSNVRPAQPQFAGHYQPHIPGELGYYDLLEPATQHRQVELAKLHGVGGFCFYTYWFGGKLLLEKPVENYLADRDLDLPFCLCWANENWSRRWDGLEHETLIAQQHTPEDDLAFIRHVAKYLRDERYIRIGGKPLLVVYRPGLLPSARKTAARWRLWCREHGVGEIYLAYTQSFETVAPGKYGFDAAIEFPPNNSAPPDITGTVKPANDGFCGTVYDWQIFVERSRHYQKPGYRLFRSVCPAWDNTARRKNNATVFLNSSPQGYQEWLQNAIADTCASIAEPDERLVFVNAWNEWAEGAHLEPDQRYGYAYLEATRNALTHETGIGKPQKIIVVSHDAHPHGAQFLALGIVKALKQDLHLEVETVLLGGGPLAKDFAALAPVHELDGSGNRDATIIELAQRLAAQGFSKAIVNTTVSGCVVPAFREAGIASVCLVHELPGVIRDYHLESHAAQIAAHAKAVVFPAQIVADGFAGFAAVDSSRQLIRAQGLYRRNQWRLDKRLARAKLRERLGLRADAKIVLAVGYADHRKGVDLFVECALHILAERSDVDFVWVGHWEQQMQRDVESRLLNNPYRSRIHFTGFNPETALFHAGADVYALTSREDPFPNVALESFDAGVPVVAFAETGGAAQLAEKVGGLAVPALDTGKFADAICRLLDNPELSSQLGEAAQNHVDVHAAFRPYLFELCALLDINLPKVSVVVPNYNYARHIEERLASIREQSVPIYELIILDDASTDRSIQKISAWLAATRTDARVVVNAVNSGSVFAQWQKGISLATGDYLWIAEADDASAPDFIETVLPPLQSDSVVLSYCDSQQINSYGIVLAENYRDYLSHVSAERWQSAYIASGSEECKSALAILNTIPNVSAVLFKRAVLDAVFRSHYGEIAQFSKAGDWLVYLRVLAHGDIAFTPRTANRHRRHEASVTAASSRQSMLQEIGRVQQLAWRDYQLAEDIRQKAAEYLERLQRQFAQ
ncbi:MAG TPA: glycoside hydrolase family 99-like domain-containing protein [Gallionella sp.]|nr:glycoside hydrolase family 99-like domain-containing protein [Gallionella sp.]